MEQIGRYGVWVSRLMWPTVPAEITAAAAELESLGYGSIWLGGTPPDDLALPEAILAATTRIVVGTSIIDIWRNGLAVLAVSDARLRAAHPGRSPGAGAPPRRPPEPPAHDPTRLPAASPARLQPSAAFPRTTRIDGIRHPQDLSPGNKPRLPRQQLPHTCPTKTSPEIRKENGLSAMGRALVDRELYLPKSWTGDSDRCRAAKIPEERTFATKGELARELVRRALASALPIAWVTADSAYGQEWGFRRMLEEAGVGYVLAVPKSQQIKSLAGIWRIDALLADAPDDAWQRLSCGGGAKGPHVYDWAAAELPVIDISDGDTPTHRRWVPARRSQARPDEIASYLAYAPDGTTVGDLVRIAGSRWAIEECFQAAKNECGLDQYEVRRYVGWYRHITLVMLAHAFLAAMAAAEIERGAEETMNPPSRPSPWQKSGDSWKLSIPAQCATGIPPAH
ncbi:IS701 family transposase [Streptomyces sp. NPDC059479]|uniref:IS701 family transposase n=1 Tax=Streptomyces sp. NPDC059479 TaxID=3346848 RepID=UPI00368370EC